MGSLSSIGLLEVAHTWKLYSLVSCLAEYLLLPVLRGRCLSVHILCFCWMMEPFAWSPMLPWSLSPWSWWCLWPRFYVLQGDIYPKSLQSFPLPTPPHTHTHTAVKENIFVLKCSFLWSCSLASIVIVTVILWYTTRLFASGLIGMESLVVELGGRATARDSEDQVFSFLRQNQETISFHVKCFYSRILWPAFLVCTGLGGFTF